MTALGNKVWMSLYRFVRRQEAAARLAARKCAECKALALHGPPMTAEERRQHGEAVAAVRRADEAKRQ
jgi:hypothetical protein